MSLSGGQADLLVELFFALGFTAALFTVFRRSPKLALASWILTVGFVPVWFALPVFVPWMPATLVGILALAAAYPWNEQRFGLPDAIAAGFFFACLTPMLVSGAWSRTSVWVIVSQWGLAYTIGRFLPGGRLELRWIYGVIAAVMGMAGFLAVAEFMLHWNPFVEMSPPWGGSRAWRGLQARGGIVRAEGAFGHSIALGCSLALAVPLAIGSGLSVRAKSVVVGFLLLGAVVSFSRLGMVTAALGLLLSVIAGTGMTARVRAALLTLATLVAVVVAPRVLDIFAASGTESAGSAKYRVDLVELVPSMAVFGYSSAGSVNTQGELTFLGYRSIDSALILLGLVYGLVALVLAIVLLLLAVRVLVLHRAEPPTISIVAQIPALMTVALITQYAMLFWFVAGLAIAAQARKSVEADGLGRSVADAERDEHGLQPAGD